MSSERDRFRTVAAGAGLSLKTHPRLSQEFEFRDGQRPLALQWLEEVERFYKNRAVDPPARKMTYSGSNDVLEITVIQHVADLVPNLAHHRQVIRHESIILFLNLAAIFDRNFDVQKHFDEITAPGQEKYEVRKLMLAISTAIIPMLIGFVSGLEAHYLQSNIVIRDVAVAAITALIHSNSKIFVDHDHLTSIWNLIYLIDIHDDNRPISLLSGTRLTVIVSLRSLCGIICNQGSSSLIRQLIQRCLTIPGASTLERTVVQATIEDVFQALVNNSLSASINSDRKILEGADEDVANTPRNRAGPVASTTATMADAWEAIQGLLSARTEAQYDLLHWASQTLARIVHRQASYLIHLSMRWFLDQIQLHLNPVSPHLVRYGSVLIVHGLLSQWPDLIDQIPDLFSFIINTCCDRYQSTREISLSILHQIGIYRQLHTLVDLIQLYEGHNYQHQHRSIVESGSNTGPLPVFSPLSGSSAAVQPAGPVQHTITLSDVLGEAVLYSPNLSSVQLTSLLASSRYMTDKIHLDMLSLIGHWAKRAQDLDPHFVQILLPMLQTRHIPIQQAVLSIFRALSSVLVMISRSLLRSSETFFRHLLSVDDDETGSSSILVLEVLTLFPLHNLPSTRLQKLLCDHLAPKAFSAVSDLRHALYNILAGSRRFWTSNDLSYTALSILLIGFGDQHPNAVKSALRGFQDISSEPQWKGASSTSAFHSLLIRLGHGMQHRDQGIRINAYNHIINTMCNWTEQDPLYGIVVLLRKSTSVADQVRYQLQVLLNDSTGRAVPAPTSRALDETPHSVFWYILLLSKLGIRIGQATAECALRPLLACNHAYVKAAAVDATIKTCFRGTAINGHVLDQAVADAVTALLESENETIQDSWICVLDGLVRHQVPGLNSWLALRLLPTLTELYADRPVSTIRRLVHLLDTLIVCYVANASSMTAIEPVLASCLERLRNTTRRNLLGNIPNAIRVDLQQLYAVLAEAAATLSLNLFDTESYMDFLLADVEAMLTDSHQHGSDPLLSNLSESQRHFIGRISITGLASCHSSAQLPKILHRLTSLLCDADYEVRRDVLSSIFHIIKYQSGSDSRAQIESDLSSALWQTLALLTDHDLDVRVELERGLTNGSRPLSLYVQAMKVFDSNQPNVSDEAESFVSPDGYDCGNTSNTAEVSIQSLIDDDYERYANRVMQVPILDQFFVERIRSITARYILSGHDHIHNAIRNLFRFLSGALTAGSAAIIISELLWLIPENGEILEQIVQNLCSQMDQTQVSILSDTLNGFSLALTSVSLLRPELTLSHIISWASAKGRDIPHNDGVVYALHAVITTVRNRVDLSLYISRADRDTLRSNLRQILQLETSTKRTRKLALELDLILSAIWDIGPFLMSSLMELIQILDDPDLQDQVILASRPLFQSQDQNDSLVQGLLERFDQYEQNGNAADQHRALTLLSIVSDALSTDDTLLSRTLILLADTDAPLRRRAIKMIMNGSLGKTIQSRFSPILEQQHKCNGDRSNRIRSQSLMQASRQLRDNMAFRLRTSFLRNNDYSISNTATSESSSDPTQSVIEQQESITSSSQSEPVIPDDPLNSSYLASERYSSIAARYHSNLIYNPDKVVDDANTGEYGLDSFGSGVKSDLNKLGSIQDRSSTADPDSIDINDQEYTLDKDSGDNSDFLHELDARIPVPPTGAAPTRPAYQRRTVTPALNVESSTSVSGEHKTSSESSRHQSSTSSLSRTGSRARLRRESARSSIIPAMKWDEGGRGSQSELNTDTTSTTSLNSDAINDMSSEHLQAMLTATVQASSDNANVLMEKLLTNLEGALDPNHPETLRTELKSRLHSVGVLTNLIASLNQLDDRTETSLSRLRRLCSTLRRRCINLRQEIIEKIDEQLYSHLGLNPVMIINQADTDRIQKQQEAIQRSMIDPDYRQSMIRQSYDRQMAIESDNRLLSALVIFIIEIIKGFGRLYAYLNISAMMTFTLGMEFMVEILTDDHDAVRKTTRDALQQIIRGREDDPHATALAALYEKLVVSVHDTMADDANAQILRRKKADLCAFLGLLLPQIPEHSVSVRDNCVKMILSLWDDTDMVVRDVSIDTIRVLGAGHRIPELEMLLKPATASGPCPLMQLITARLNSELYSSKDKLQNLMQWLFNRR